MVVWSGKQYGETGLRTDVLYPTRNCIREEMRIDVNNGRVMTDVEGVSMTEESSRSWRLQEDLDATKVAYDFVMVRSRDWRPKTAWKGSEE